MIFATESGCEDVIQRLFQVFMYLQMMTCNTLGTIVQRTSLATSAIKGWFDNAFILENNFFLEIVSFYFYYPKQFLIKITR